MSRGAAGKRPVSSPGDALRAARQALSLKTKKLAATEAELAWMNGEYVKLKESHEASAKRSADFAALEMKKIEKRLEDAKLDIKAEQEFTKREQVARDEWKAFAIGLVIQLIAIDSVVKDAQGDEPAAVRQLVLGAKKIPHPQADPVHPNIWKWAVMGGIAGMMGAAYWMYKHMMPGGASGKAGAAAPAAAP